MNIVTALEQLAVEGLDKDHDHMIETVLSKLFVRGDEVYKAYKHRTADFADLADSAVRRAYIGEDFFWNNAMAPDIYQELRSVKQDDGQFIHTDSHDAEDWYIVMKKIDTTRDLMRTLESGAPSPTQLREYVQVLLRRLEDLTQVRRSGLLEFFDKGVAHVHDEVLGTMGWAYTADPHLSVADIERAETLLRSAINSEQYFQQPIETLSVVIDVNAENILFLDAGVSFIDVMPPKDAWRVHDHYFIVCRTSADVSALHKAQLADVIHEAYGEAHARPSEVVRVVYEIAAALIQAPYRKMVGREDLAQKYAEFIRRRSNDLEKLLQGVA